MLQQFEADHGQATLQDGSLSIKLATPKELGGAGGPGNNPKQLFAAGYAACFIGAMKAVAPAQKLRVPTDATVTATIIASSLAVYFYL